MHRTLTPHIALLTSHVASVTHDPAGVTFLAFVSFWILFGLVYGYCELTNRNRSRKQKKSKKIIEPTSAPLNSEMATASGGEAALPRTTAAQSCQPNSQGNARVADVSEEVQIV
jgi:hypothetical protein